MKQFTKEVIDDLANKLLIGLSSDENQMVLDEFEEIDRNMNLINEIADISSVEVMTHPIDFDVVVLRSDDDIFELTQEEVLKNAAEKNLTAVIVPKVVGE